MIMPWRHHELDLVADMLQKGFTRQEIYGRLNRGRKDSIRSIAAISSVIQRKGLTLKADRRPRRFRATPENAEHLKSLFTEGWSDRQIGEQMGGLEASTIRKQRIKHGLHRYGKKPSRFSETQSAAQKKANRTSTLDRRILQSEAEGWSVPMTATQRRFARWFLNHPWTSLRQLCKGLHLPFNPKGSSKHKTVLDLVKMGVLQRQPGKRSLLAVVPGLHHVASLKDD